jgi:predicted cupin superfamily sugar epimerase
MTVKEIIRLLDLQPHPREGGYFRETYRSHEQFPASSLPSRYQAARSAGTAIYYLLTQDTCSPIHRVASDEIFHFYLGDPVRMLQLWPDGQSKILILGSALELEQQPQVVVPHGVWQGTLLEPGGVFALFGCTVSPGFEYADYEDGDRNMLTKHHPAHAELIAKLTPGARASDTRE